MDVMVVGSGGREHALGWKINHSDLVDRVHAAPGNPGMEEFATLADVGAEDCEAIVAYAVENGIDLVVVGPEVPLADGIVGMLSEHGIAAFGPSKEAAQIEASKAFSKDLMQEIGVPTAKYQNFTDYDAAKEYLDEQGAPIVVKASGLAAGKGAVVCETLEDAHAALSDIMQDSVFGEAGSEVVIEEYLTGPEISIHVISDGENYVIFPPAQDHKPINEGNTGPNTGGMGTVAPLDGVSDQLMQRIETEIVAPILKAMADRGTPYKGLLYPGIMLTDEGPKVLEFNCRFGDPETQSYMRLLKSDVVPLLVASASGVLGEQAIEWHDGVVVNTVVAAQGYPDSYEKGRPIKGVDEAAQVERVEVFHAGTKRDQDGQLVNSGGRVLGVTAMAATLSQAQELSLKAADAIQLEGKQVRRDIGTSHDNAKLANF